MVLTGFFFAALVALLGFGTIFFFGRPFALTADRRGVTTFAADFLLTTFFVVFFGAPGFVFFGRLFALTADRRGVTAFAADFLLTTFFVVFFLAPSFVGLAGFADFFLTGAFLVTFAGFFGFDLAVRRVVAAGRRVTFTGFWDFGFWDFNLAVEALALAFDAVGLAFVALALERTVTIFFFLALGFFLAAVAIVPPHHSLCATSVDAPESPMPNGPHLSRTGIPLQPVTSPPVDRPGEGKFRAWSIPHQTSLQEKRT